MKRTKDTTWLLPALVAAGVGIAMLGTIGLTPVAADDSNGFRGILATKNGDVNADGFIDISDAVYLLSYKFQGGPEPKPLVCEPDVAFHNGDVNGSGEIDISDPIYLLTWLF